MGVPEVGAEGAEGERDRAHPAHGGSGQPQAAHEQAGTSRSTVHRRFGDTQGSALAVAERLVTSVGEELGRRTDGRTPQESVVAAFLGLVDVVGSNKLARRASIGGLPEPARELLALPWAEGDERAHRRYVHVV